MTTILTWTPSWYRFVSSRFFLKGASQKAVSPWTGRANVYGPHAQLWNCKVTLGIQDKNYWMPMEAFVAQLGGMAGKLRIGDLYRRTPQYNRVTAAVSQAFSDGTYFDDGSGWNSGVLSPTVYLVGSASIGDTSVVIGGLPASTARVLRRNDLVEFRPNGVADEVPRLHVVVQDAPTDANGNTRISVMPPLRAGVAAGDMVVLDDAQSIFMLTDDGQGIFERSGASLGHAELSLIEAIV